MKTVGIIALSSTVEEEKINNAANNLRRLGYNVKLSKNIFDKKRYLAGCDEDKVVELHRFFADNDIDIIMCARGGYGAIRLINKIDYEIIKSNPKPFVGFSDVTALLLMIYKRTGLVTYHGPMACSDFGDKISGDNALSLSQDERDFTFEYFIKALEDRELDFEGVKLYKAGSACGIIWGGNLATTVSLCGQDFIPDKDFIFFAEDLNEPVYKIDRMFCQLLNIKDFRNKCKGIVLGDFLQTDNQVWLEDFFQELGNKLNIPLAGGFKISHNRKKITLPIGKNARLDNLKLILKG